MRETKDGGAIVGSSSGQRRSSELLGLEVVVDADGSILGVVDQLVVDLNTGRVAGVILTQGAHEALAVRFYDLSPSFGTSPRLLTSTGRAVGLVSRLFPADESQRGRAPIGTVALSDQGNVVGVVHELVIDMATGAISGVDVLGDYDAPLTVHAEDVLRFGSEYTLIAEDTSMSDTLSADRRPEETRT